MRRSVDGARKTVPTPYWYWRCGRSSNEAVVAADVRLTEGSVLLDQSMLTRESVPIDPVALLSWRIAERSSSMKSETFRWSSSQAATNRDLKIMSKSKSFDLICITDSMGSRLESAAARAKRRHSVAGAPLRLTIQPAEQSCDQQHPFQNNADIGALPLPNLGRVNSLPNSCHLIRIHGIANQSPQ